ncbi:MAG: AraC family transcriptional regulator [Cyanobacteria bacterium P01_A01_bin.135]
MKSSIQAWQVGGVLIEYCYYPPSFGVPLPKHSHIEYQLGVSTDTSGGYRYRGTSHPTPAGHFSLLHSGEVHTTLRKGEWIDQPRTYWMMYIPPEQFSKLTFAYSGAPGLPFFPEPVICDRPLLRDFLAFFQSLERPSALEHTERLLACLSQLVARHAEQRRPQPKPQRDRRRVQQVQAYLDAHLSETVTLQDLAQLVDLSPYHLHRLFRQQVGLPLHQYQISARVARAKQLLLQGLPLKRVAEEAGFADQSHFTRQFKRLLQVTPGQYQVQSGVLR